MSSKPETRFTGSVHKYLPQTHIEKMSNPWRSGTADVWYSGDKGDLWVEYKFIEKLPRNAEILPDLSPQQLRWLNSRFAEGRNVAVIVGTPTGGVIYREKEWAQPLSRSAFEQRILSRAELAHWIFSQTGAKHADHTYRDDRLKSRRRKLPNSRNADSKLLLD